MSNSARFLIFSIVLAAAAAPVAGATGVDQMLIYGDGQLSRTPLPAGPPAPALAAPAGIAKILVLPSGQVLATTVHSSGITSFVILHELMPGGSLREIGGIPPAITVSASATVLDMELDPRGDVHVVTHFRLGHPHFEYTQLAVIDPVDGGIRGSPEPSAMVALAGGPEGFWGVDHSFALRKYDPVLRAYGPPVLDLTAAGFGMTSGLEADSAGRLYFKNEGPCGFPPCLALMRVDPKTGEVAEAPWELYGGGPISAFAIERFCQESENAICLQDGRFRAEVTYAAYDGSAGSAVVAPARSSDTGIFSFFDPDNWELMVKVLDGCAINGHVWVYAAASTDVGYVMTITDTLTGAQKVYSNALGHVAETVTDGSAFSCLE
jgi:hypothetical protein